MRKSWLRILLLAILVFMGLLIGGRLYLLFAWTPFESLNATHIERIRAHAAVSDRLSFAVVGNIKNSTEIFEQRILPLIDAGEVDFVISAGNAVQDGGEDKYWWLYRGLRDLQVPYVLGVGENELEDFGTRNFYRHFGPYYFSFALDDRAGFVFLDATGETSWDWQLDWLERELKHLSHLRWIFVVLGRSPLAIRGLDPDEVEDYRLSPRISARLQDLFARHGVTAVFSAGYPGFQERVHRGVHYIVSGGGGGLLLGEEENQYQLVRVDLNGHEPEYRNLVAPNRRGALSYQLETLKLYLHSFFFVSLFNFLLFLGLGSLIALRLYTLIRRTDQLYRDFSIDEDALSASPIRVAMFTNNYLPFVGGVPLSIERLRQGLQSCGDQVRIFAPAYRQHCSDPEDGSVVRCPLLFGMHLDRFPVVNVFSRSIRRSLGEFRPDIVHLHHPFWLGRRGLQLARRRDVPVVFTFHTRLEQYMHYLPLPGIAFKNLLAHALIRRFADRCDAIVAPTASTEEYLRNLGVSALIETIPTGIQVDAYDQCSSDEVRAWREQYCPQGGRLLICIARLAREKNLDFLIDGLARLKSVTDVPFRCLLIGDGPERERLQERVRQQGLDTQVQLTGNLCPEDVVRACLAADLFVFASTSETQGMVLLEAMAGGTPVVAVRASGVQEVVHDGYNGYKVAESTRSWAQTIATVLADDDELERLAANSREFAREYSVERVSQRMARLYRRVLVLRQGREAGGD